MKTVNEIMGIADAYAYQKALINVSKMPHSQILETDEARSALLTALQDLVSERDAYQQAADKLAGEIKDMQRQEPVAWRLRIGDSDVWSPLTDEFDCDFYGRKSGLKYVKEPLYAAPQPAQPIGKSVAAEEDYWRNNMLED